MDSAGPVGFIGLGIMGSRQAAVLRREGFDVVAFNRTRAKADAWVAEHGGAVAATPREVAERCDVVITMVVDGAQVEAMLLGPDGAAEGARDGATFMDMSTIAASDARRIGSQLRERGIAFVDAPVSGSAPKAEAGTLTIMAGGEPADVERVQPLLDAMGEVVVHVGPLGQGQMVKLVNQALAAINCAAVAQALVAGARTGVDLEALVRVVGSSSGASTMLALKAEPMLRHDYTPLFRLEHMLKDVRLCLEECQAAGVPFPFAAAARDLYTAAAGRGLGGEDFAAVLEAVEGLAAARL